MTASGGGAGRAAGGATGGTASGGAPGTGGMGGGAASGGRGGNVAGGSSLTIVTAWPNGVVLTGVRGVTSPALTEVVHVRNGGTAPVMITAIAVSGANQGAFQINGAPQLPMTLAAGGDLPVTVQVLTTGNGLPPAPTVPKTTGGTLLIGTLTVTAGSVSAQANLFGLLQATAINEPTLGQILTMLGYKVNVGAAQNNANPVNPGDATKLPKIEANTDEIAAPFFVKAGPGNVTLVPVARFSPKGLMPFGWYPKGTPSKRNEAGVMTSMPDAQTSDKARMVLSPTTGPQSFDPGTMVFGIWSYTDQLSQVFEMAAPTANGDYSYSEDAPNSPANAHRTKVYPLKNAAGTTIANSYLIGVEEAGNGDYQDYVFVLGNAAVAP